MPKRGDIHKVLVIGSAPVPGGYSAELNYASAQACRALKEEGMEVVFVSPDCAAAMTGRSMADHVYTEPVTFEVIRRIIDMEKPDSVLPIVGGDRALDIAMELSEGGYLETMGIQLLGIRPSVIRGVWDKELFRGFLQDLGEPCVEAKVVEHVEDALEFAQQCGYPVFVRRAYTFDDAGTLCHDSKELNEAAGKSILASSISQILIEKSILGYKQIELEVVRDGVGNCICLTTLEKIDPVQETPGDSLIAVPAQTLTDLERADIRACALHVVDNLNIQGCCSVRFAVSPQGDFAVIRAIPRITRGMVLASKATGYPAASVAAKIVCGFRLDEIQNPITGSTFACSEPAMDYCVVRFPRWLSARQNTVGEVIAFGSSFELAFMKAIRAAELGLDTPEMPSLSEMDQQTLERRLDEQGDDHIFAVFEMLKRGVPISLVSEQTGIDYWYLSKLNHIAQTLNALKQYAKIRKTDSLDNLVLKARQMGFTAEAIGRLAHTEMDNHSRPVYKMVDTCAAEFDAIRPYFYSTWDEENEAEIHLAKTKRAKQSILIIGAGPTRIDQGAEFDYCTVHCAQTVMNCGMEAVIVNNNPETLSTDFDICDRLYFDPLSAEDIRSVYEVEKPDGVVVQFSGQRAQELTEILSGMGAKILGTSRDVFSAVRDKNSLFILSNELNIPLRLWTNGQASAGKTVEVDAIGDGESCLIAGLMEYIERSGMDVGDDITVYPAATLKDDIRSRVARYTQSIVRYLGVVGLVSVQFTVLNDDVYLTSINPYASRTIPYISKTTGVPVVQLATRCMLGDKLKDLGYGEGIYPESGRVAVKVPVFAGFSGGPARPVGDVLGISDRFETALYKGLIAAGYRVKRSGGVLLMIGDHHRWEINDLAEGFLKQGFNLYADTQTAGLLNRNFIAASSVNADSPDSWETLVNSGRIDFVVLTDDKASSQSQRLRALAASHGVFCFYSLESAEAILWVLRAGQTMTDVELIDSAMV